MSLGIGLRLGFFPLAGVATPAALPSFYLRPDGVSRYLRPDGVSLYLRP